MNIRSLIDRVQKALQSIQASVRTLLTRAKRSSSNIQEQHEKHVVRSLSSRKIPSIKQLRFAWRVLSKKEQHLITRLLGLFLVVVVVFVSVFIINRTSNVPTDGGTYTEGFVAPPQFLNPVLAFGNDTDTSINRLVFAGLMRYTKELDIVPDLAERVDVNEEKTIYTVTLRDEVYWHDEEPVTVDDVIFTYQMIQDPQYNSPHYGKLQGVTVERVDQQTIRFTLDKPFASFISSLTLGIIPQHVWETIPPANTRLAEANLKPTGAGPFKFNKLEKDKNGTLLSYTFVRNDAYHGQIPYIESFQTKFYGDVITAADALAKHNIDALEFLPRDQIGNLTTAEDIVYHTFTLPQYTALFINPVQNESLASLEVRTALAHALDRETIVRDVFNSEARVVNGPLLPGLIGYDKDLTNYAFNADRARELLTNSGWVIPEGERFLKKNDTVLEITVTTVDVADTIKVAELIRSNWQNVGVKVNLEIVSKQAIEQEIIAPRNYQVLLFGQILGSDPDPFPFWHSSKRQSPGVNLTAFANKQADALLEQARTTVDDEERGELYKQFQELLVKELPALFLYSPTYTYPVNNAIKGLDQTTINVPADRFNSIADWYTRTKRSWTNE